MDKYTVTDSKIVYKGYIRTGFGIIGLFTLLFSSGLLYIFQPENFSLIIKMIPVILYLIITSLFYLWMVFNKGTIWPHSVQLLAFTILGYVSGDQMNIIWPPEFIVPLIIPSMLFVVPMIIMIIDFFLSKQKKW